MSREPLDKRLYKILACPKCKRDISYNNKKTMLVCSGCRKSYPIKDGIPILLVS